MAVRDLQRLLIGGSGGSGGGGRGSSGGSGHAGSTAAVIAASSTGGARSGSGSSGSELLRTSQKRVCLQRVVIQSSVSDGEQTEK
jgi:hypothetical protein